MNSLYVSISSLVFLLQTYQPALRTALVHDALYASQKLPREVADAIFLDLMKQHEVGYMKRQTMYYAVRSAGWYVWRRNTKEEIETYKEFINVEKINS